MPAAKSLLLITGPPNTGKAGEIVGRLLGVIDKAPMLVVPTADDVDRFQRELVARADSLAKDSLAVVGTSIVTFNGLVDEVVAATGLSRRRMAGKAAQLAMARRAARETTLREAVVSAATSGFAPALLQAVGELRSAGLDPATVSGNIAEQGDDWRATDIAKLFARYVELLEAAQLDDIHSVTERATMTLRSRPESWRGRPVFFYGFDDFSVGQLALVEALAEAAEVVVSVIWEDRESTRARARLLGDLVEIGAERVDSAAPSSSAGHGGGRAAVASNPVLEHLARCFLQPREGQAPAGDGVVALVADGNRGQAEQVASTVARLLAEGVDPGTIEVVLRNPDADGPKWDRLFNRFDIPVATLARVDLRQTSAGGAMLALVRLMGPTANETDLVAWLRLGAEAGHADAADALEARLRRRRGSASGSRLRAFAAEMVPGGIPDLPGSDDPAGLLRGLAEIAGGLGGSDPLEMRAAATSATALADVASLLEDGLLGGVNPLEEAAAALSALDVPLWTGPAEGRVRITSPQRLRANRSDYLIVCSLQDGEFPRYDRPRRSLIGDDERAAFGLPEAVEAADEDAYLFGTCLAHPRAGLFLSWQQASAEGTEKMRSQFVDEILRLLPGGLDGIEVRRRGLAEVVFPVADAPSGREVARGLAVRPEQVVVVDPELAAVWQPAVEAGMTAARYEPAKSFDGEALADVATRESFRVTELERFVSCPWCWFTDYVVRPNSFQPDGNPMTVGIIVHGVLERLYLDPPGGGPDTIARPETLPAWLEAAGGYVAHFAREEKVDGPGHEQAAIRARAAALVAAWLEHEAGLETDIRPERDLLEAPFGGEAREGGPEPMPALELHPEELPGVTVRGKIDRVDKLPGSGAVVVRDFKTRSSVENFEKFGDKGIIQPQLYAIAMNELWGREIAAAMFVPLGKIRATGQRGAAREELGEAFDGFGVHPDDFVDEVQWELMLEDARATAVAAVEAIREGRLPMESDDFGIGGTCGYGAVCSRDRKWKPGDEGEDGELGGENNG